MTRRVYTIPPDASFVTALAEGLWRQAEGDPLRLAAMLVLLPTRRACRALRGAFVRVTGGRATLLPRLQPIGDADEDELYFAATAFPDIPPAITPLRRQMLLTRLVLQKEMALPLDQAAELAAALADLLDQMQIEQRDFSGLKDLVREQSPAVARHWQETLQFLEIVTAHWPAMLAAEGCLDPAARRNRVLAAQAAAWRDAPPDFPVIAAGSTASMPAVAAWLAVIAGLPQGMVVLPGLDQALDEEAWQKVDEGHPQFGMKQWLEHHAGLSREAVAVWPTAQSARPHRARLLQEAMRPAAVTEGWKSLTPERIPAAALAGLHRLALENQQDEAAAIALRMRAVLEEPDKTATLVTPDRALAARVAAALGRWGIAANDSAGQPLTALPTGSFLREVLQAATPNAGAVDYLSLLKHPLTGAGQDTAQCRVLARQAELALWRDYRRVGGWAAAARAAREKAEIRAGVTPPHLTSPARGEESGLCSPEDLAQWLAWIAAQFEPVTASWHEPLPLDTRIRQHLVLAERMAATDESAGDQRLWRDAAGEAAALWFDEWQQAAKDFPALTGADYLRLFTGLSRSVTVRPRHGQHPRLSILGPLEARLDHADLMILGGLNEGVWPPEPPIDPWLSRPMKADFKLPLPERRIGLSAHDFVQLASAPQVLLTRARRVGTSPAVPSRFLLQLDAVLQALGYQDAANDALACPDPWREWARQLDEPPPDAIKPCERPSPRPPLAHRPKSLRVTEISVWQRNPYAIYARHILKLEKLEAIDKVINAAERGTMVHAALEQFLTRYRDTWPEAPLDALLALGREAFAPFRDQPQVAAFWWPRFAQTAQWFVAEEAKRRQQGIRTLAVEAAGQMLCADGAFALRGRADRIDRLPDGALEIIDYKTGAAPSLKDVERGYEPQLPLLALMAEAGMFQGVGGAMVGALSYWLLQGKREGETTQNVKKPEPVIVAALAGLERLLEKFADPATPYEAVPKPRLAPRYDDYAHLARLVEWGREEDEA